MNAMTRTLLAAAGFATVLASAAAAGPDLATEADALLAERFNTEALAALSSPAEIDRWTETAILDGSTDAALDEASEAGVELVMTALFDEELTAPSRDRTLTRGATDLVVADAEAPPEVEVEALRRATHAQ